MDNLDTQKHGLKKLISNVSTEGESSTPTASKVEKTDSKIGAPANLEHSKRAGSPVASFFAGLFRKFESNVSSDDTDAAPTITGHEQDTGKPPAMSKKGQIVSKSMPHIGLPEQTQTDAKTSALMERMHREDMLPHPGLKAIVSEDTSDNAGADAVLNHSIESKRPDGPSKISKNSVAVLKKCKEEKVKTTSKKMAALMERMRLVNMLPDPEVTTVVENYVSDIAGANALKNHSIESISHAGPSKVPKISMRDLEEPSKEKAKTASKMLRIMERLRLVDMLPEPDLKPFHQAALAGESGTKKQNRKGFWDRCFSALTQVWSRFVSSLMRLVATIH